MDALVEVDKLLLVSAFSCKSIGSLTGTTPTGLNSKYQIIKIASIHTFRITTSEFSNMYLGIHIIYSFFHITNK
jgi:hypothetical protein